MAVCLLLQAGCAAGKEEVPPQETILAEETPVPAEESVIDELMKSMTLQEKLCQMMMPSFRYISYGGDNNNTGITEMNGDVEAFLQKYHFGGVILFAENFETSRGSSELIASLQAANGGDVPLLIGVDQEGGTVTRIPFSTMFMNAMALGAAGSADDIYSAASVIGDEVASLGINTDFAPVADVNSEPSNPVIGVRSFSDDPAYAGECAVSFMKGLRDQAVIPVLKHFPGHGDTVADSHTSLPQVSKTYEEIQKCELVPFRNGIREGADMIMTAHIQYPLIETGTCRSKNGEEVFLPATMSKKMITDILRNELGFAGVVISDSLAMDAIKEYFSAEDVITRVIGAGVDMFLMPADHRMDLPVYLNELESFIRTAAELAEKGEIDQARIDASVRRILSLKEKYGILSGGRQEARGKAGSYEHHQTEMRIAKDAVTIVEGAGNLPAAAQESLAVFVPYASQVNSVAYALQEAGRDAALIFCYGQESAASFRNRLSAMSRDYDKIIAVSSMYGESYLNGSYAAILDILLADCRQKGIETILISAGLPYDLARFEADCKLACYDAAGMAAIPGNYDGDVPKYGPALPAAVLTVLGEGEGNGKLPVDIPEIVYSAGRYRYGENTRYPRGTGKQ